MSRVNHILRVHGFALVEEGSFLKAFDAGARKKLERLFPSLTEGSFAQAALGAKVGGLGWRIAIGTAKASNIRGLMLAAPKINAIAGAATRTGLLSPGMGCSI